jgi:hypothetical protein
MAKFMPFSKISMFDRMRMAHWYPCPGWVGDPKPARYKFERWQKRSQKAWMLYWRMRPELYRQMTSRSSGAQMTDEEACEILTEVRRIDLDITQVQGGIDSQASDRLNARLDGIEAAVMRSLPARSFE